jgi:hypothetical protein
MKGSGRTVSTIVHGDPCRVTCACDAETEIAKLRAGHPSLWLFDFRPVKGEG